MIFRLFLASVVLLAARGEASYLRRNLEDTKENISSIADNKENISSSTANNKQTDAVVEPIGQELSQQYRASIQADAMLTHLQAFQSAADASGGIRAAGSLGFVKSLQYVAGQLLEAGYSVDFHDFLAPYYEELTPPQLSVITSSTAIPSMAPANTASTFLTYRGSGSGTVQANLYAISSSGCSPTHFTSFPDGGIAMIQGGTCNSNTKLENALNANASAVILVSRSGNITLDRFKNNLPIPVLLASKTLGNSLTTAVRQGDVVLRVAVNTLGENRINKNIIAETTHGDPTQTIVVGGHLDSVFEGPGISDNGSGSAGILELALQLKRNGLDNAQSLQNKIRFCWWGAEDVSPGVIGSTAYVASLSPERISQIAMYINMDMIGSPNFVRFILDGDGSVSKRQPLPHPGSPMAHIEATLHDYFDEEGLALEEEPLSTSYGYTDHTPFYNAGVPVTDIHTGVGFPKTEEQAAIFGGEAGEDWDPCYHKSCDTIDNVNVQVMEEMTRAAAHAIAIYGSQKGELFAFEEEESHVTVQIEKTFSGEFP